MLISKPPSPARLRKRGLPSPFLPDPLRRTTKSSLHRYRVRVGAGLLSPSGRLRESDQGV